MSIIEKAMQKLAKQDIENRAKAGQINAKVDLPKKKRSVPKSSAKHQAKPSKALTDVGVRFDDPDFAVKLVEAGILPVEEQLLRNDDEYRRIKRPLLANAFGKGVPLVEDGCLIMVTSSLPDEGKTHTVTNLALSMAKERDHSVLLLDADVAKADVSRIFGVYDNPGLTELLSEDNVSVEDVIVDTPVPNLSLIPAGSRHTDTTELLASERMNEVIRVLAEGQTNKIILIDSPPLLVTPEPQVLASLVGQIVLVAEAVKTPKHIVAAAIDLLDTEKPINLVLNKGNRSLDIGYYGAYHYGHSRYQD